MRQRRPSFHGIYTVYRWAGEPRGTGGGGAFDVIGTADRGDAQPDQIRTDANSTPIAVLQATSHLNNG